MRQRNVYLMTPPKNDAVEIERHKAAVLRHFGDTFSDVYAALKSALPRAKGTFALHEGPVDLAVHAPWVRYLVRLALSRKGTVAIEEDDTTFDLLRVPNCGLCLRTSEGDIRILKNPNDGLPKALSAARVRFVTNNQLVFAFAQDNAPRLGSLNLFVLWKMNAQHELVGIDIACPKTARDNGDIECYWVTPWNNEGHIELVASKPAPSQDLDEIVSLPSKDDKKLIN